MGDPDVWPLLLDMSRDDCKRILRRLELEAYSNLVSVLRAQGSLTAQKRRLLQSVAQTLGISEERHKAECRRAVNSEKLATIAKHMGGANSGTEWAIEGRRLVPLLPRLVPQTAFTAIADKVANMAMTEGAKLPLPTPPGIKRLASPPIDESLLEPNVPEASKTPQISEVSLGCPLLLSIPAGEMTQQLQCGKSITPSPAESHQPPQVSSPPTTQRQLSSGVCSIPPPKVQSVPPFSDILAPAQMKQEKGQVVNVSQPSTVPAVPLHPAQPSGHTSQPQAVSKSQVVLLVKKEERSQDERLGRKRPRSASLDVPLNVSAQVSMMPPPMKKEAISPLSPHGTMSPLGQLPLTISPQSHSQLVQQQTLQAAAAAAAAVSSTSSLGQSQQHQQPSSLQQQQLHKQQPSLQQTPQQQQLHKQQQSLQQTPHQQQPSPPPQPTQQPSTGSQPQPLHQPQQLINPPSSASQTSTPSPSPSARTITIPSQGAVKLSLQASTPNSGSGIPSGTHKVIIVSSTTPSILQRSLSVPVVKSLSTSAPSQPSSSTLVLNTAQQTQQVTSSATSTSGSVDTTPSSSSYSVSTALPAKVQGKIISQSTSKTRPRANSIVIPVTPNQSNVINSVGVTNAQLKSALQAGKQGLVKSSDGLKIMPLANINTNSKLISKASGSGPLYVVSSTSSSSPSVSMVARTVSSGQRVMTFTSTGPKVTVSTSQGGNVLSKPIQTLQLTQASGITSSSGSIPMSSTSGKPNVIVVQKGSAGFGRGITLSHGGKEVVGKVLLGGKALTTLNPNQTLNSTQLQTAATSSNNPTSNSAAPVVQVVSSQTSQSSAQLQPSHNALPSSTSAPTRVVTVQKLPSAVVQGSSGSSNVIVLDLSQEQLNNSAVLNEILASSILQSSNVVTFNHSTVSEAGCTSINSLKGLINFASERSGTDSGVPLNDDGNLLVEELELDHSVVSHSDNSTASVENDINSEFLPATCSNSEMSAGFVVDDSSFHAGRQSSNGATSQSSRGHTDICATAMSNANLNLNDFLDDSNLDDIQPLSLQDVKMEITTETGNDPENNFIQGEMSESVGSNDDNAGNWVASGGCNATESSEMQ